MLGRRLEVWWCGIGRPRESAYNGVVGMYHPTPAVVMEHGAVTILDEGGCPFFSAVGNLGASAPC